jgi:hypothetical protein
MSLQPNSETLQRNSNIAATEFQQFQKLELLELNCSGGESRRVAASGGARRDFCEIKSTEIRGNSNRFVRN